MKELAQPYIQVHGANSPDYVYNPDKFKFDIKLERFDSTEEFVSLSLVLVPFSVETPAEGDPVTTYGPSVRIFNLQFCETCADTYTDFINGGYLSAALKPTDLLWELFADRAELVDYIII